MADRDSAPLNLLSFLAGRGEGRGSQPEVWPFSKFVFVNVFTLIETIYPIRWAKPFAKERKKSTFG